MATPIRLLHAPLTFGTDSKEGRLLAVQLNGFLRLAENWDREGASAPVQNAVAAALDFLNSIPIEAGTPKVMLLASGEPAFYWDRGDLYAEIGFDELKRLYAYAEMPGRPPVHIDDAPIERGFPVDILELMRAEQARPPRTI